MPTARAALPAEMREQWSRTYAETPYRDLPWFSPTPTAWVTEGVRDGWWKKGARILELGCGAGTNSLFLAKSGFKVSGVDVAEGAITAARSRAEAAGLRVDFRVGDVLRLPYPDRHFGGAVDIGCFHTFPIRLRSAYAREVARVLRPRATFALSWVGREARQKWGPPHRPSVEEVAAALEEKFLFLRTEFRARKGFRSASGLPVYCAALGRRSIPRPPVR